MKKYSYFFCLMVSVLVFWSPCYSSDTQQKVVQSMAEELRKSHGSCKAGNAIFDLGKYILLKENKIELKDDKTLEVEGEKILVTQKDKKSAEKYTIVYAVDEKLEENVDLDIDLTLALSPKMDDVVVYWRETFKHKSYRQGIVRILENNIEFVCEGRGGVDSTH